MKGWLSFCNVREPARCFRQSPYPKFSKHHRPRPASGKNAVITQESYSQFPIEESPSNLSGGMLKTLKAVPTRT